MFKNTNLSVNMDDRVLLYQEYLEATSVDYDWESMDDEETE